eukprot:TRINITY_DN4259_c0_g1_i2.p1 TRINITY_DN4259_c0_g1~~TRINITY_DN4259_c0_g1_i2.p1  ORF type:complete len:380 (+),score=66.46 TRINITY_DN4259_c0_g1_i2:491-1630(+)
MNILMIQGQSQMYYGESSLGMVECHRVMFNYVIVYGINSIRWAGIKALGHASCAIGNTDNHKTIQDITFSMAKELLKDGGYHQPKRDNEPENKTELWKKEDVYLVQYAAMQALGLLVRSNPGEWWDRLSPLFCDALINPGYAAMVKASVMITYSKLSYYMTEDNPYNKAVVDLLIELTKNPNILISEPATYSLVNYSLAHQSKYNETMALLETKIGPSLRSASENAMLLYLKSYCKLIARNYKPSLSRCASTISIGDSKILPISYQEIQPGFERSHSQKSLEPALPTPYDIAQNPAQLLEFCTHFSTPIIQSVVTILSQPELLDHLEFLQSLKILIEECKAGGDARDQKRTHQALSSVGADERHVERECSFNSAVSSTA